MKLRLLLTLGVLVSAVGLGAQDQKPRIAIKTFENPANYQNSTIGNALTEILTTELGRTGKFRLIEREAVAELMKEISFGQTDWSKSPTFAKKGGFRGADFFLLGKVTNFSYRETTGQRQVSTTQGVQLVTVYDQSADVRVDFRMVSTRTGEAVLTEAGSAQKRNLSYTSELNIWNRLVASGASATAELSNSLIGRATEEAIRDVVRKLNDLYAQLGSYTADVSMESGLEQLGASEGKILADLGQGFFIVSLGSNHGVTKGDRLEVLEEIVTKNKKGEVVYREQKPVGSLEVVDVSMQDRAKARHLEVAQTGGSPLPHEGDGVRIDLQYARALRGAAKTDRAASSSASGQPAVADPAAQVQALIEKGDRFVEERYYSQALEQYDKALSLSPENPDLLDRLARAKFFLNDFLEGEAIWERALGLGGPITIPIAHNHTFGSCSGVLVIEKGTLSYRSGKSDDNFKVDRAGLLDAQGGILTGTNFPRLVFRWRDVNGKEKTYYMLLYGFLEPVGGGSTLPRSFVGDEEAIRKTSKVSRLVLRLVNKYVK